MKDSYALTWGLTEVGSMVWDRTRDIGDVYSMAKGTIKVFIVVGLVVETSMGMGSMLKKATSRRVYATSVGKKDVDKEDCVSDIPM